MPDLNPKELDTRIQQDREEYVSKIPESNPSTAIKTYRDYADGKQLCTLLAAVKEYLSGALSHLYSDNVMHQVIAEASDRLQLLRFDVQDDAVTTFLQDEIFIKCHLANLSGETHYAALRDGDFALMPEWSERENRVLIQKEDWWNGDYGVFVAYEQQQPVYAVKEWTEKTETGSERKRRNVYFDDRIERYVSSSGVGGSWEMFSLETDTDWPQPWEKPDGSPLHIPIVHFANGGRGPGNYGRSELAGGVLGNQDGLNDKRYDIDVAARMTAFQMVTASGYKPVLDKQGNPIPPKWGPGGFLASSDPAGRFDVIEAGDLSQLENVYKLILRAICRMTRTPLHAITGDWPSGEALLRAELPATNKARRQAEKFKTAWATLAHRCVEIANAFGLRGLNEDAMVMPTFAPVSQLGELQQAMSDREFWTAAKLAVEAGYPLAMYLEDHNWDAARIKKLQAEMQQQADQAQQDAALVAQKLAEAQQAESAANGNARQEVIA